MSPPAPEPPAAAPSATAPPVLRIDTKVSSSARGRSVPKSADGARAAPHRTAKPAKAAVVRTADDFGI
jgi:hypothetical protein